MNSSRQTPWWGTAQIALCYSRKNLYTEFTKPARECRWMCQVQVMNRTLACLQQLLLGPTHINTTSSRPQGCGANAHVHCRCSVKGRITSKRGMSNWTFHRTESRRQATYIFGDFALRPQRSAQIRLSTNSRAKYY